MIYFTIHGALKNFSHEVRQPRRIFFAKSSFTPHSDAFMCEEEKEEKASHYELTSTQRKFCADVSLRVRAIKTISINESKMIMMSEEDDEDALRHIVHLMR